MKCPRCQHDDDFVYKTYSFKSYGTEMRVRTRMCRRCAFKYDTLERIKLTKQQKAKLDKTRRPE